MIGNSEPSGSWKIELLVGLLLLVAMCCFVKLVTQDKGLDVAISLIAEAIAFSASLFIVDGLKRGFSERIRNQRLALPKSILYAKLIVIVEDLAMSILSTNRYEIRFKRYKSTYGDSIIDSRVSLYPLGKDTKDHRGFEFKSLDAKNLERVRRSKEELSDTLDRASSLLEPENLYLLLKLEQRLEKAIDLLNGASGEDFEEATFRDTVTPSLILIVSSIFKVKEWLDRALGEHFELLSGQLHNESSQEE